MSKPVDCPWWRQRSLVEMILPLMLSVPAATEAADGGASLVHRRIQLMLRAIANLLVCQGLGFDRPESSVCVAALAGRAVLLTGFSDVLAFAVFLLMAVIIQVRGGPYSTDLIGFPDEARHYVSGVF